MSTAAPSNLTRTHVHCRRLGQIGGGKGGGLIPLLLFLLFILLLSIESTLANFYTDQWAVHIEGGPQKADQIAAEHDFVNLGMILPDYYHFQHRKVAKRSIEPNENHHKKLILDPNVKWAKQQVAKRRAKRDLKFTTTTKTTLSSLRPDLNDPLWPQMWYLNRGKGLDMNVQSVWSQGITGKGIVVTILDDGLEKDHPDIKHNYDPLASYDVNNHDDDPQPRYDFVDSNRHGTRCAGEVAADANNSICAVGVAYEAKVGGVRMLDGDVTDAVEARSLSLNPQHIDIYSASWGPDDDGKTVDGPGELASRAFMDGVKLGRDGLGSIFVWASGNGGRDHDNCNCDGYTNSIWTLSISSATENGLVPWYSEACSSTLSTTYSSGSVGEKQVVTTDLHYGCTSTHTGTSASAPLAAGICALVLQVNPKLTWRDMQHIVVRTARPANLKASDWATNGVGRNVSHSFGYGLMDAAAMVNLARNWTTVPPQRMYEAQAPYSNKLVPAKSKVTLTLYVDHNDIRYLEHVQAKITMSASRRGDIQIFLKSPSGTRSCLLDTRPHDTSQAGFHSWPFMTVHNWGEDPRGIWMLEIHNEGRYQGKAKLKDWLLILYGTKEEPGVVMTTTTTSTTSSTTTTTASPATTTTTATTTILPKRPPKRPSNPTIPLVSIRANNASTTSTTSASTSSQFPGGRATSIDSQSGTGQGRHSNAASVSDWKIVAYGTKEDPDAKVNVNNDNLGDDRRGHSAAGGMSCGDLSSGLCLDCTNGTYLLQGKCVAECPIAYYPSVRRLNVSHLTAICLPCHYTCKTCNGPNDYQCIDCFADAKLRDAYCRPAELLQRIDDNDVFSVILLIVLVVLMVSLCAIAVYIVFCRSPIGIVRSSTTGYKRLDAEAPLKSTYMYEDKEEDDSQDEIS